MKNYLLRQFRRVTGIDKVLLHQERTNDKLTILEKKIDELYKASLFNSTISGSIWLKDKSLSPGRMAADYAFLYTLYRVLNDFRPHKIVEFGMGQTTRMISQYCEENKSEAIIFEHDAKWIGFFSESFSISKHVRIINPDLEEIIYKGEQTVRYKGNMADITGNNVELIIVDGPKISPRYSRIQVLDLVPEAINRDKFCVLIDDYQRRGEQETSFEMMQSLQKEGIPFINTIYSGEKEHLLICSANNEFLLSL